MTEPPWTDPPADKPADKPRTVKRRDPDPRPVEGILNQGLLAGKDPMKHYVWVSEANDPTFNVATYRALGYHIVQYDAGDEAIPTIGYQEFKQGDPVKSVGAVLMACPMEHKRQLDQQGWDQADRIQDTISKRDIDPLTPDEQRAFRGITSVRAEQDNRARWRF